MEKICGFYVSEIHLVTMILPYIQEQLKKEIKIKTIFENNLNEEINKVLNNLIIDEKIKNEILKIKWKKNKIKKYNNKYNNLEKEIAIVLREKDKKIILICGCKKYIQEINNILNNILDNNRDNIQIINCYKVLEFDDDINEILDKHKYILNTSGIHKINEIFEDYKSKIAY